MCVKSTPGLPVPASHPPINYLSGYLVEAVQSCD
jgi:hypothetical protein